HLLEDRVRLQPSISVVHASMLVAATLPAAWALTALLSGTGLAAALVALAVAIVFVGELLPRAFGRDHPRTLAYRLSRLLDIATRVGEKAADMISDVDDDDRPVEDFEAHDEDDRQEIELISSVLEFSDTLVREVMVPRTDMMTVERIRSSDDALDVVVDHGFSRIPVTGAGPDDIVGVVYAKDLLRLMDEGSGPVRVSSLMREPYFVPETKLVPDLLREMQLNKTHMAIVVDEFGGTAGLVTIEDLLEELVGEIVDEYDTEEPMVQAVDDGWVVDGRLSVDDLNDLLGTDFRDDEWDTVAGLVLELAGRVPVEGEHFEHDGVVLEPQRIQGRRVGRVKVGRRRKASAELEQA
ncbi:MAG: hemolysin family protein, partial [Acidimicrobiia bacterium]|nr:hemolysin family protein [Acidimicrobiia bacterium]